MSVSIWGGWRASRPIRVDRRRRKNRRLQSIRLLEQCEERTLMATALGLTFGNVLIQFDTASPGTIVNSAPISGLAAGDNLVGLDFRPATGELYGLGSGSHLYTINPTTGAATQVGAGGAFSLNGTTFGFDFNPVPDRLRVTSDADQNLRLNPNDGTLAATDGTLAYASGDPNSGVNPNIVASAYTNSFGGATATTLYDIDSSLGALVIQNPPNSGTLNTVVGGLGFGIGGPAGFDIQALPGGGNAAYAALATAGPWSSLYTIDLTTGAATLVGGIGASPTLIVDIAIVPEVVPNAVLYGIDTANNNLVRISSTNPSTVTGSVPITGLVGAETIIGLDFRPATGQLYGLGNGSHLYTIDPTTGAATQVGAGGSFTLSGTTFGFDFNPVPDRLRVTSDADQNLRLNPNDGTLAATDGTLAYASGDPNSGANPNVVASAYTNSFEGSTTTTLYDIDSSLDALVIQNPPNSGTLNTVVGAGLGIDVLDVAGFDIQTVGGVNVAFATLTTNGSSSSLYTIDLTTGAATQVGSTPIGGAAPRLIRGLAVAPFGSFVFSAPTYSVGESGTIATITINRVLGSEGVATVRLTSGNGTATSPGDYTGIDQVLVFGPGQTTQTVQIPVVNDALDEADETINLTLTAATGGALLGTQATAVLTVIDDDTTPVAVNDAYALGEDGTLAVASLGVLTNDTDADGGPLTATLVTGPASGTLTLNADGSFSYTPNANFNGVDGFTYRATDGTNLGNVATVTLTVTSVDDAPVSVDDSYNTSEDTPLTVSAPGVLANDSDVENDPITAIVVNGPNNGTLALNAAGSFTYTPNLNFSGVDGFTYQTSDGTALGNIATVILTVTPVNDAPLAVADSYITAEDTPLTVTAPGVMVNDADAENDPITAVLVTGPAHGTLTFNPDGSFSYAPQANYNGPDGFTYAAVDGSIQGNTVTVSLTVTPVNDAPVALAEAYSTPRGTLLTVAAPGLLANDTDVEGNPLTAVLVTGPAHGTIGFNADGSFAYNPAAGFTGADSFTYRSSDGTLVSGTAVVSLTVTAVNSAPVVLTSQAAGVTSGQTTTVAAPGVLGNSTDADGNPLTATLVTPPAHGSVVLNPDGSYLYTANAGFSGRDQFTFRASDGTTLSNIGSVILNVSPIAGPRVQGVSRYGYFFQKTSLVVKFSERLDQATATALSNYRVTLANGRTVAVRSARYVSATNEVVLTLARRLPFWNTYGLSVCGGSGGIRSASGVALDGAGTGSQGTNYSGTFNRTNLAGPDKQVPR